MGGFFQELAKKLAERWVTLLVLPGALFIVLGWLGFTLGHDHALDWTAVSERFSGTTASLSRLSGATQGVLVVVLLLAATGVGLAAQALAGMTRTIWLGTWPRPFAPLRRRLTSRRETRWMNLVTERKRLQTAYPQPSRTAAQQDELNAVAARLNHLALARPGRPTWMGDRMHGVEVIARNRYGLDLTFGWPRLWLLLPEPTRTEITQAHTAFAAAVATGAWAWPYLLLAGFWWPSAAVAAGLGLVGWARGRSAVTDLAALSEAALDLHGRTLAVALGVSLADAAGPLTTTEGEQLTALFRKGR
ncbi:hypothetical protein [Amycolatopsis tolypomycina]|uniref:hypothetical protein n=1 Tax=Amycolatopsis tolypomycina TaxID=208445 RepID=UPI0033AFD280